MTVYLDNAATTRVRTEALEAMLPFFAEVAGNASSLHAFGQRAKRALEDARRTVAQAIGAEKESICFTSGGTESDNLAILGVASATQDRGRHLITSAIEHHAVLHTCAHLASRGYEVTHLPVDRYGLVHPSDVREAMREDTVLVSIMLANNETGTLEPLHEIAEVTRERGVSLHTDAVQALGKMPVDVDDLGVDLLSLTAHKFHGPKGVGALYVRQGTPLESLMHGGHQEHALRPGTENVPGVVGLATALRLACEDLREEVTRLAGLRDRLESGIRERIDGAQVNGHPQKRLPSILNVSVAGVDGEALLLALDMMGVAVSTGSACTAGSTDPSHVLRAMGVPSQLANGSLRFSLGRDTQDVDIDHALDATVSAVHRLRALGPDAERFAR